MPCTAYWHGVAFLQLATRDMHARSVAYWRAVGCSCVHFQRRVLLNLSFSGIERLMHLLRSFLAVLQPTLPTEARFRVEKDGIYPLLQIEAKLHTGWRAARAMRRLLKGFLRWKIGMSGFASLSS